LADAQQAVETFTATSSSGGGSSSSSSADGIGGDASHDAPSAGAAAPIRPLAAVLEVAGLIFLAEWGDRSMLATIALGAAQVGCVLLSCCVSVC
jgi:putative Ca2+/H+ antiporter (TMEM165/GDT1 family)